MPSIVDFVPAGAHARGAPASRRWQNLWVRLAVALAFADASIVVLALPQIVERLHTSISHSIWVIIAYNLALIVASVVVAAGARHVPPAPSLIGGLALFGAASLACGASDALSTLIVLRCAQGIGGALVLAASLPAFAAATPSGDSPLRGWSAAAAVGAAVGPAVGGVLTQLFDWRSIFIAQAPVAAVAAVAVLAGWRRTRAQATAEADRPPASLDPLSANLGLLLLSAGLIGTLFLVVVELITAWQVTPLGAAAVVLAIPASTAAAGRLVRSGSAVLLGAGGAILVAAGLVVLALVGHRQLGLVAVALLVCGAGLGLAYPGLTAAALESGGTTTARAARTIAARDLGLVVGLLVLTPVFVARLNGAVNGSAPQRQAEAALLSAPLPLATKLALGERLVAALDAAGTTSLPDVAPAFKQTAATATPAQRAQLAALHSAIEQIIARTRGRLTDAFRLPFLLAAGFALLVLPLLAFGPRLLHRRLPGRPVPGPA